MHKEISNRQPWLYNKWVEFIFILFPPFACLSIIALFPQYFTNQTEVSEYSWVLMVLLIDVAHVYSTLYRTYFDKGMWQHSKTILYAIPLIAFLISVMVYSLSSFLFWRIMAYVAVFHFIRQQYGFMRLYGRKETSSKWQIWFDKFVIYYATVYPILFWHFSSNRNFNWFVEGDFFMYQNSHLVFVCTIVYYIMVVCFFVNTVYMALINKQFNFPKFLVVIGTLLSWYFGIVYFNGDMPFTLLNVVSHGIPYMALVWIYGKKQHLSNPQTSSTINKKVFAKYGIIFFVAIIILLAYAEEGLWDILVWKENKRIFHFFDEPLWNPSHQILSFIVPLLALPQITHYIIDGFIWKMKTKQVTP